MTAKILDGASLARSIRKDLTACVAKLHDQGIIPGLAVVLIGDQPASAVYVKHKINDCNEIGIKSYLYHFPSGIIEEALLSCIHKLNSDPKIHGILVQLPLPTQIRTQAIISAIDPRKDVDGFHVENAGALMLGNPGFLPCTPYGVMKLLEHSGTRLEGAEAVVVGRSNIVGKPQAMLLMQAGCTITICHRSTKNLSEHTQRADILIAAVGQAKIIKGNMVKPGSTVIDVGINRNEQGSLEGDVDFESVKEVAAWLTPVPGGVGPMTRAMLMANTLHAVKNFH